MIVKDSNSKEEIWVDYGILIEDTRRLLADNSSWLLSFTYREANNTAHLLARLALNCNEELVWIEEGPL